MRQTSKFRQCTQRLADAECGVSSPRRKACGGALTTPKSCGRGDTRSPALYIAIGINAWQGRMATPGRCTARGSPRASRGIVRGMSLKSCKTSYALIRHIKLDFDRLGEQLGTQVNIIDLRSKIIEPFQFLL